MVELTGTHLNLDDTPPQFQTAKYCSMVKRTGPDEAWKEILENVSNLAFSLFKAIAQIWQI